MRETFKHFIIRVDGKGHAGDGKSFTPPKLAIKVEEYRSGGMNTPVEVGMGTEKMESSFSLASYSEDVLTLFGVTVGNNVPFIVNESLENERGQVIPVAHHMRGIIKEIDPGEHKPGELAEMKVTVGLHYYKLVRNNKVIQEIHPENMIHTIDGKDMLAEQRQALGI